ncbi:olfactory receptor 52H1-like [Eptesicus fuscus]|uniref:olfactory receptor 52H1-like n=1 Tax=Eptesicus fuscus TaxID=29078 RepID=UPI0024045FB7|nr:olfactory receptor 52H1-like [Eptesicus fuscus]
MTINMMTALNLTTFNPESFILVGIPGLEQFHIWIGIPFCTIYLVALAGNGILLYLITMDRSLHEPMFFFLSMLASTDLILCTTCVPKMLGILWLKAQKITFSGCLTQLFFLHFSFFLDSAILLGMAFDRYLAICSPLRYSSVLTPRTIIKIMVGIVGRSFSIILPVVFLVKRLPFCRTHIIPHTYCEHIAVAQLSCASISINIWYGFTMPLMAIMSDLILIGISYTLILRAVFHLPSRDARQKALSTCGSHVSVILIFYTSALFSAVTHRFGHNISRTFHIMFANLYVAIPPALNPIIYGVKTKQIRDKVVLLLFPKGNSDLGMRTWKMRLWKVK